MPNLLVNVPRFSTVEVVITAGAYQLRHLGVVVETSDEADVGTLEDDVAHRHTEGVRPRIGRDGIEPLGTEHGAGR